MERDSVRQDRRLEVEQIENRARAEALGLDLPPDVTVPWWRIAELERRRDRAGEQTTSADAGGGRAAG
jgi:hypothetical protein